ncbi:MAG TPA: MXAN_6640 family putative metalloprotease, partial [Actinomycetota bacterium]
LARPIQGSADPAGDGWQNGIQASTACSTNFCFHWVTQTADAVPLGDTNGDGIPNYIEQAASVFENVRNVIHSPPLSFRPPKSDISSNPNGGNAKLDVYFTDTGDEGNYGYCTTDDPNADNLGGSYSYYDVSAYCVLDNDFSEQQFDQGTSGVAAMQVTAAHEYFHAVQYAYDVAEDKWLMEGSATWMEDVVYDDVNDYLQYLPVSQMELPGIPLDFSSTGDSLQAQSKYGAFLFFRFLQDHVLTDNNGNPTVAFMQQIWQNADSTRGAASDQYSIQAVKSMLAGNQEDFATVYTTFGVANLFPSSFYEEGELYAPLAGPSGLSATLSRKKPARILRGTMDHLTTAYAQFKPGKGARASSRLKLAIDAPDPGRTQGGTGSMVVLKTDGSGTYEPFTLNSSGDLNVTVPFGKGTISSVIIVLSNASTSYTCFQPNQPFACHGLPTYDDLPFAVGSRLLR